ncbi:MAG TPA: 16S rRNA (adenine(1518)-N(6)/adenine(1519)-N(6))-dimethyltransferase RsmA, partial [Chthoniobacterales bacterium]
GLGSLTQPLLKTGARLTGLELDSDMVRHLRAHFAGADLTILEGDAARADLAAFHTGETVKVIGNLPYSAATAIVLHFCGALGPADRMVFMVQKEVAERLAAAPCCRDYGSLTLAVRRYWDVKLLRILPPEAFHPRPKVHSAVVEFRRKAPAAVPKCDERRLETLIRQGFSERRKQLRKLIGIDREKWESRCAALGCPPTVRAEELSPDQWAALANLLTAPANPAPEEIFDVVDENDTPAGQLPRGEVHARRLRHRAVHILIFNAAGRIFLQKRAAWKDINPWVWDSGAAGHLSAGEDYLPAAHREIQEELGVDCAVEKIGKLPPSRITGNEFIEVFTARHEGPFRLERMEIATGAFFDPAQIREWSAKRPRDFSPVFLECLKLIH